MRIGLVDATGYAMYVAYKPHLTGFYDNNNNLIRSAMPNCDYHIHKHRTRR
jgi:hypothetical protein